MTPERLREIAVEIERYNHIKASKELLAFATRLELEADCYGLATLPSQDEGTVGEQA